MGFPVFAQAAEATRVATTASDKLMEYGGLGIIVVILFAMIFGGLWIFGRYMMPGIMQKWSADLLWYQATLQRQEEQHDAGRKEQADAFLSALDHITTRFSEDLKGLRSDFREELKAVVAVVRDLKTEVNDKLDRIMSAVKVDPPPQRRHSNRENSGGGG